MELNFAALATTSCFSISNQGYCHGRGLCLQWQRIFLHVPEKQHNPERAFLRSKLYNYNRVNPLSKQI